VAQRKDRMALLSRYSKLHFAKYNSRPEHNLNKEQWAADALIESYTLYGCYDLLEYYFESAAAPSWKYFANSADNILSAKEQIEQDRQERIERRKLAKEWLSE
jgi:hypothetical protein